MLVEETVARLVATSPFFAGMLYVTVLLLNRIPALGETIAAALLEHGRTIQLAHTQTDEAMGRLADKVSSLELTIRSEGRR